MVFKISPDRAAGTFIGYNLIVLARYRPDGGSRL